MDNLFTNLYSDKKPLAERMRPKSFNDSLKIMLSSVKDILKTPSFMLCGSIVMDDFRLGWSDIDFLCVTENEISEESANLLLDLRQKLTQANQSNMYFKLFEGTFVSKKHLLDGFGENVVYWGTSGQKITDKFKIDPFTRMELIKDGKLLMGNDFKNLLEYPTRDEIVAAVRAHYESIRKHGKSTGESLYSAGWILDIARCLYTLRQNALISKTKAGEWALKNGLCPNPYIMKKVLKIRKNPAKLIKDNDTKMFLGKLEPHIMQFADVLQCELENN